MRQLNIFVTTGEHSGHWITDEKGTRWVPLDPPRTREQAIAEGRRVAMREGALADELTWSDVDGGVQGRCPWPDATTPNG